MQTHALYVNLDIVETRCKCSEYTHTYMTPTYSIYAMLGDCFEGDRKDSQVPDVENAQAVHDVSVMKKPPKGLRRVSDSL